MHCFACWFALGVASSRVRFEHTANSGGYLTRKKKNKKKKNQKSSCNVVYSRAGIRAVDLGGPSVYQGEPKFEVKHNSRCLQKSKLVDWGGQACQLGGPGPLGLSENSPKVA